MTTLMAGRPDALETKAVGYRSSASAILEAADELGRLVFDQESKAVDKVAERTGELATGLGLAHRRYSGTASALKVYAVELRDLQRSYTRATDEVDSLEHALGRASAEQDRLTKTIKVYGQNNAPDSMLIPLQDDLLRWQQRDNRVAQQLGAARGTAQSIERDYEDAARRAIDAIDSAIRVGKDSFWAKFQTWVEDVYETFVNIAKWVDGVIKDIVKGIISIVAAILTVVLVALIIAVAIAAIVAALGAGIAGIAILIQRGLMIVRLVEALILTRVLSDVLKPTPNVSKFDPERDPRDGAVAGRQLHDVAEDMKDVDAIGGADPTQADKSTGVKIQKVIDAYGNVSWRVVLPSTQDWQALTPFMSPEQRSQWEKIVDAGTWVKDDGSVSDIDSNLALKLFPGLQTQYERAVFNAMEQAGIKPGPNGDPVMLVGFSQGGLLAAHIAANRSDAWNVRAVLTFGSPVGDMIFPDKTKVVSVEHEEDIAHRLRHEEVEQPNRKVIRVHAPEGKPSHGWEVYGETFKNNIDEVRQFAPEFDDFFVRDDLKTNSRAGLREPAPKYYQFKE